MNEPTYLEPLNKDAALKMSEYINALLDQIAGHETKLSRSYARLGGLLREVKNQQFWMTYGYDRFSSYLEFVRGKIGRERSQVYAILSVAEALLPLMSESELEAVGITRAHELRRLVGQGGSVEAYINVPIDLDVTQGELGSQHSDVQNLTSVRIMDYASRPGVTAKQLRVKVNELLHIHEDVQGLWFDPGGFYATPDERKEIDQFWVVGKQLFGSKDEQPDHVWKKEVFLAAIRESLSTWSAEVSHG